MSEKEFVQVPGQRGLDLIHTWVQKMIATSVAGGGLMLGGCGLWPGSASCPARCVREFSP